MKSASLLIFVGLIFYYTSSLGQEIYRWVDEKGTVHFADDLTLVPERYQDQVQKKIAPKETSPALPPSLPPPTKGAERAVKGKEIQAPPVQKDILGRGEEWWRAKAKEWKDKLSNAQKNYDTDWNALKAKEKELGEPKFKPDSLKRKLKADIKALQEKVEDWKKQIEEANNMLDKVLPKEAEDFRADPSWLKTEK
jgi:hypothetical protein